MFEIRYRIVPSEHDDFDGDTGFLQIRAGDYTFGEIRPDELNAAMEAEGG